MQVFICYSRADKEFAAQLLEDLSAYDLNVWMDVRSIPSGANWDMEVQRGLDASDTMLVLLSPPSVSSQNVADEWSYFIEKNRTIIPLMVEPCEVPFRLSRRQRVDFTHGYKEGFHQLLKSLGSPTPLDPDSTQPIRTIPTTTTRERTPSQSPSIPKPASPATTPPPISIGPEVGTRMYEVIWSPSYNWLNGMGAQAQQGDMMIDRNEAKLIPHAQPIISIPVRSLVSAVMQRSVDNHLKITYYGPDGAFRTMYLMGSVKAKRKDTSNEILNILKLVTGRSLI